MAKRRVSLALLTMFTLIGLWLFPVAAVAGASGSRRLLDAESTLEAELYGLAVAARDVESVRRVLAAEAAVEASSQYRQRGSTNDGPFTGLLPRFANSEGSRRLAEQQLELQSATSELSLSLADAAQHVRKARDALAQGLRRSLLNLFPTAEEVLRAAKGDAEEEWSVDEGELEFAEEGDITDDASKQG